MLSLFRIQIISISFLVVFSGISYSAPSNQLAIGDRCTPSNNNFKQVDQIVLKHFNNKDQGGEYYFLGKDYYLVLALNTGRIVEGIYVVNTKTESILKYGGYGYPTLNGIIKGKDGSVHFRISFHSMHQGNAWTSEYFIHLRYNQIIHCPYLIKQNISSMIYASEELESFCANPKNKKDPACSDKKEWGKTKFHLTDADIDHIVNSKNTLSPNKSEKLWKAYQKALQIYKKNKKETYKAVKLLEDAGVLSIIDSKPQSMPQQQYISILNDYAFFIYGYGEGLNMLAIDILDKVIKMSPNRKSAYLNMSQALEDFAQYGATKYSSMPLDKETIAESKTLASKYLEKYKSMN
jgi:hypothetical protein